MTKRKRKNSSRRFTSCPTKNHTGDKQERSQDPRTKRKMKNSRRDFQMARSVLLQIMINALFLSCYFQCPLCQKVIKPATPGEFRNHLKKVHAEEKCQTPGCIYVSTFSNYTLGTLFMQATSNKYNMKIHMSRHGELDQVDCPCCGSSISR